MTETVMLVSNPYDGERRPGTVGFPLPGVELRLASRDSGTAVLFISEELDEIIDVSDRVVVMYEGEVNAEFEGKIDRTAVGRAMGGVTGKRKAKAKAKAKAKS